MAIWQFDFYLVPCERLAEVAGASPERLSQEQFELTTWWKGASLPFHYPETFTALLHQASSWHPEVETWGEEDGNRVEVSRSADRAIEEVRVRLDVRGIDIGFLEGLTRFASDADYLIVTEELEVIEPQVDALLKEIQDSSAYRFVLNPGARLEEGDLP